MDHEGLSSRVEGWVSGKMHFEVCDMGDLINDLLASLRLKDQEIERLHKLVPVGAGGTKCQQYIQQLKMENAELRARLSQGLGQVSPRM